jgi:hypothetical protein
MANPLLVIMLRSRYYGLLLFAVLSFQKLAAQEKKGQDGIILHFHSAHTSFPDTGRLQGHLYDSVLYDRVSHYEDSSVLVLVPESLRNRREVNLVFWFHGWRNNIDTALQYYHLKEQFLASNSDAILVMAETARNSPDSYGGKLEQSGMFSALVGDLMAELRQKKILAAGSKSGNIILAGHSGAFRVIAYILEKGGLDISEVVLFDALYSQTDKFGAWIKGGPQRRFINWYTNQGGGTDEVSQAFMEELKKEGMPVVHCEESALSPALLQSNRIVFVHSPRPHNDIIFSPDNFRLVLENSHYLNKVSASK